MIYVQSQDSTSFDRSRSCEGGGTKQITTGQAGSIEQLAGMHGVSARFIHAQMKLVLLSPQSIESMMTRRELLPLSLDNLLTAVPMNWREQTVGLPAKSA